MRWTLNSPSKFIKEEDFSSPVDDEELIMFEDIEEVEDVEDDDTEGIAGIIEDALTDAIGWIFDEWMRFIVDSSE